MHLKCCRLPAKVYYNYKEDVEPDLFQQEHHKTEKIQQEHHKTEYHLCEVMAGISFCKLNIYKPFFHLTYYKSNLDHLTSQLCTIYICDVYKKIYSFKHQSFNIFTSY
jgi:hypothetical protein